jgi:hypothetical protein
MRATAGAWQVLNDAYSAAILGITDAGVLTDIRGLPIARDPGTSAPPVGSIVLGVTGAVTAGYSTFVANGGGNLITVTGINAAANATITSGTWRNCGSNGSTLALLIRTA